MGIGAIIQFLSVYILINSFIYLLAFGFVSPFEKMKQTDDEDDDKLDLIQKSTPPEFIFLIDIIVIFNFAVLVIAAVTGILKTNSR